MLLATDSLFASYDVVSPWLDSFVNRPSEYSCLGFELRRRERERGLKDCVIRTANIGQAAVARAKRLRHLLAKAAAGEIKVNYSLNVNQIVVPHRLTLARLEEVNFTSRRVFRRSPSFGIPGERC